jgi:hypothetical protein
MTISLTPFVSKYHNLCEPFTRSRLSLSILIIHLIPSPSPFLYFSIMLTVYFSITTIEMELSDKIEIENVI